MTSGSAQRGLGAILGAACVLVTGEAGAQLCAERVWDAPLPDARQYHAMAFDAASGRVVLFGGDSGPDSFTPSLPDTWALDGPQWTRVATAGPSARFTAGMAYDSDRRRVVLFGGGDGHSVSPETWEWDGASWVLRAASGPQARTVSTMVYDAARRRTVMFGGYSWSGFLQETWEWDGSAWTLRSIQGPSAACGGAMAFDEDRRRVVYYGCAQTWEWDGTVWQQRPGSIPGDRGQYEMAYDGNLHRVVLWGGVIVYQMPAVDTWAWDGAAWTRVATEGPDPRVGHRMVFDSRRGRLVLFGGSPRVCLQCPRRLDDLWEFDGRVWSRSVAPSPPPRVEHVLAFHDASARTVVVAGATPPYGYFWPVGTGLWDGQRWTTIASGRPAPRRWTAMAGPEATGRLVLFGGQSYDGNPSSILADTWRWDGAGWTRAEVVGPPARIGHAMAAEPSRGRVLLFGGESGPSSLLSDTWEWDGVQWLRVADGPSARSFHAMAWDPARERVVMFGGYGAGTALDDTWEWDGAAWSRHVVAGPSPRAEQAMAYDPTRGRIVMMGAGDDAGEPAGTWEWDGSTWMQTGPSIARGDLITFDSRRSVMVRFGPDDRVWEWRSAAPSITRDPLSVAAPTGGLALFSVAATGGDTLTFRWRRDGLQLSDGPGVRGAASAALTIGPVRAADAGAYNCVVANSCGSAISEASRLTIVCMADFNGNGEVTIQDFFAFLAAFAVRDPRTDIDRSGSITVQDFLAYLAAFAAGC